MQQTFIYFTLKKFNKTYLRFIPVKTGVGVGSEGGEGRGGPAAVHRGHTVPKYVLCYFCIYFFSFNHMFYNSVFIDKNIVKKGNL